MESSIPNNSSLTENIGDEPSESNIYINKNQQFQNPAFYKALLSTKEEDLQALAQEQKEIRDREDLFLFFCLKFIRDENNSFERNFQEFKSQLLELNEMLSKDFNLSLTTEGRYIEIKGFISQAVAEQYKETLPKLQELNSLLSSGSRISLEVAHETIPEDQKEEYINQVIENFKLSLKSNLDSTARELMNTLFEQHYNEGGLPVMALAKILTYDCTMFFELTSSLKSDLKNSTELHNIQTKINLNRVEPAEEIKQNFELTKEQEIQRKIQQVVIPLSRLFHDEIHFVFYCMPLLFKIDIQGVINTNTVSSVLIDMFSTEVNNNCRPKPKIISPLTSNGPIHKMILAGRSDSGKTQILQRMAHDQFNDNFLPTIGIDFAIRQIQIQERNVKLQIWDTAGQERFRTITSSYFKGAHGCMIVFDLTNKESFDSVPEHVQIVKTNILDQSKVPLMLVGNKLDLCLQNSAARQVSYEQAMTYAKEENLIYIEVSAKTNTNVKEAFVQLSQQIIINAS